MNDDYCKCKRCPCCGKLEPPVDAAPYWPDHPPIIIGPIWRFFWQVSYPYEAPLYVTSSSTEYKVQS